ncbi:hypothetical protein N7510_009947 [Penicillium lagena]|uniref:uncharacterized protein n=1 Tax=Penicillium lagena TaxID=94218 RepID=UPI0025406AAA|nr:uncharacterized protein N7510_009947 [Penicillium lagena]KAJ5604793.1 hypothetical protein N7510_009947 [Penicillium lagena]
MFNTRPRPLLQLKGCSAPCVLAPGSTLDIGHAIDVASKPMPARQHLGDRRASSFHLHKSRKPHKMA